MDINLNNVESDLNKSTNVNTDQASNTKYPSVKAVFDWATNLFFPKPTGTTSEYLRGDGSVATFPTIPSIAGLVPETRTINGLDLSANRTLTTAEINDSTNKRYVTDAQLTVIGNTSNTNTGDETKATINSKLEEQDLKVTGNQSTTSTTAVTVNNLINDTLTAGKYAINGFIGASSTSTAGLRIGFNLPTGATLLIKCFESGATTTQFFDVANTLSSVSFIPRNGVGVISIEGTVTIGATSGTMQVIFAKTTSGTASILDEGTFLTVKKIA